MGRGKGRKGNNGKGGKKGAQGRKRSRKPRPQQSSRVSGGDLRVARAGEESLAPSTTDAQGLQTNFSGGRLKPPIHHDEHVFNPSVVNAHNEGNWDVTMVDVSPARAANDGHNPLLDVDVTTTECTGIEMFKAAASRDVRDGLSVPSSLGADANGPYRRSLEDAYVDHPDMRLTHLDEQTLRLAGKAVKQVVLEATYEFLQKCIPASDQQQLWDQILSREAGKEPEATPIAVPEGILDLKNGTRPVYHLIGNCIGVLSQDFSSADQKGVRLVFNQGITLCDALNDARRKMALECALHSLDWLMLGGRQETLKECLDSKLFV